MFKSRIGARRKDYWMDSVTALALVAAVLLAETPWFLLRWRLARLDEERLDTEVRLTQSHCDLDAAVEEL